MNESSGEGKEERRGVLGKRERLRPTFLRVLGGRAVLGRVHARKDNGRVGDHFAWRASVDTVPCLRGSQEMFVLDTDTDRYLEERNL